MSSTPSPSNQVISSPGVPADRVPTRELVCYSSGPLAQGFGILPIFGSFILLFSIEFGIDIALLGFIQAGFNIFDGILSPFLGHWSDNCKSRWGRRRPFIIGGSVGMALVGVLFWVLLPKGMSQGFYVGWIIVWGLLHNVFLMAFSAAYPALGIELSPDYKERTRVAAFRSVTLKLSAIANGWYYPAVLLPVFAGAVTGALWVGIASSILAVVFGLVTGLGTKERFQATIKRRQRIGLIKGLLVTVKNRMFLRILGANTLVYMNFALFGGIGQYITIFYIFGGNKMAGGVLASTEKTIGMMLGFLSIPLVWWLANRLGKSKTLLLAMVWMMIGAVSKWWLITPEHPYFYLIIPFFFTIGMGALNLLIHSMLMDVLDTDELETGERREGVFTAVMESAGRISQSLGLALSGIIVKATGFDLALGGQQTESTFTKMRLCISIMPGAMILLGMACLVGYTLNERRMKEIRVQIEGRRRAPG